MALARVKSGMRINIDLTGLAKTLGAAQAMTTTVTNKEYQELLIEHSYRGINEIFNSEAAAYAAAGGSIKHMFEWGTQGINRGRTNKRPFPNTEAARLWRNHMTGIGFNQTLTYTFKPSLAFVPKPTVRDTGMSTETISKLRDHVFTWKAMVMETGASVTIRPVEAKFILMPGDGGEGASQRDSQRGYRLGKGPYTFEPGRKVAGNFTSFWAAFWEERAQGMFEESIEAQILSDFERQIIWNKSSDIMPAVPGMFAKMVEAEAKKAKTEAIAKAKTRTGIEHGE